ncbi:hypothetical protein J6590_069548 [Homalodisca vitripennis]|nr:hypothetical protein J6590_069548 [Homalodisca vitripennis]
MLQMHQAFKLPRVIRRQLFYPSPWSRDYLQLNELCHQNLKKAFEQSKYYCLRQQEMVYRPRDLVMRRVHVLSFVEDALVR